MNEYLNFILLGLIASGIWFGAVTQYLITKKKRDLDDFLTYKRN